MRLSPLALISILLLAGCTFAPVLPSPSPNAASPSPSARAPVEDPVTVPSDPAIDAAGVTCRSLLDAETLDRVDRNEGGLQFWDDIDERVIDQGSALAAFVDAGGVVCQIGFPRTDNAYLYAYGSMTGDELGALRQRAESEGMVRGEDESIGVRYCTTAESSFNGDVSCYLFRDGDAFFSSAEPTLAALVESVG